MSNPLATVTSWLYHLGDVDSSEAAKIAASDAGLVVIDYANSSGDSPEEYTPAQLDAMRGGKDKLIVSYLSVGEAEDYRPYWQSSWDSKPPSFLSASNPEWPDNYKVKYWDPAWQKIVFDYVDSIIDDGFNGLYLDIIDAFQYWEEVAPKTGIDYRAEMAKFVAAIDEHANAKLAEMGDARKFVIIGQNGEELVDNPLYLSHIDGLAKEDLRFYYPNDSESSFKTVPDGWYSGSKPYLEAAEAAGVQVFVVEYMTQTRQSQYASTLQSEIDYLHSKNIPLYVAEDRDLISIYTQPAANTPISGGIADGSGNSGNGTGQNGGTTDTGGVISVPDHTISGTSGADKLNGTTGADAVHGLGGNDIINALGGHDTVNGGAGNDTIHGDAGDDRLAGDGGADRVYGDDGNDSLSGDGGNDSLYGGNGNDSLSGGTGANLLVGGAGTDTAVYSGSTSVSVNLTMTGAQATGRGTDTLQSIENLTSGTGNDRLTGNMQANLLDGGAGNDTLSGGGGNDRLHGGVGRDVLIGGAGSDTFVVLAGDGRDTINDFQDGVDHILFGNGAKSIGDLTIVQSGADTVISFDDVSVTLKAFDHTHISAADLYFV